MTRDKIIPTLKVLYRIYTDKCHVQDISGISTFTFGIHTLYHDADYDCNSTESSKILNYLVKFNYLKELSCQYYFTEEGFNLAFKSSHPYKYFHHTNWKFIYGTVCIGIILALTTLIAPTLGGQSTTDICNKVYIETHPDQA